MTRPPKVCPQCAQVTARNAVACICCAHVYPPESWQRPEPAPPQPEAQAQPGGEKEFRAPWKRAVFRGLREV
jgi:hypothetical protein